MQSLGTVTVGASLLAKNAQALRSSRLPVSSLTIFASKLAPTVGYWRGLLRRGTTMPTSR
ncbi:hypothetical protein MF6394_22300 [Pseudomonas sp. MF6394]|nr:hypothetical protein MF6394_22300 [Pseudomonas sp. MF6394]